MAMRSHATRFIAATGVLILIVGCAIFAFRHAGRWLIHEDRPSRADVILVLSGSMPYRAEEAAKVYRAGYASEIWLTHPVSPAAELRSLGIHYESDEDYNAAVLMKLGVPPSAIHVLPNEIVDTEQELEEADRQMQREGKSTIIIVTSLEHTRRAGALWHRLFGAGHKAIVHGAPEDPFDADHWWRNTRDSLAVMREYLGLLNAWTGLHVRPHSA
ncbi:MAG TPA: YdcF family protein [Candidatus Acidoferrales bacterium]|nr:YdcF family protein [Candidatus Acidoferrales bacterium]